MVPKVAIVGRPNVGKSTLFNRLVGERISITDDMPGVTRDRIYSHASWMNKEFNLIDTGGIELSDAPFLEEIKAQVEIAIDEAEVIVFLTDARSGLTTDDEYIAKKLYKSQKKVVLAVNKVDDIKFMDAKYDFYSLGFGEPIVVSANHGIGIGDLLDAIVESFGGLELSMPKDESIKFSIIGRPNVGKSSLTNTLLGDNRVIVSNVAGTTRDAIDTKFKAYNQEYTVIDTAGLRKKGKIYENAEKYSVIRAVDAIERSDVVLLVLDASTDIIEQDKHVGEYLDEYNRPAIIVVNKWDLIEKSDKTQDEWTKKIRENFKYLSYCPIVFLSAKDNKRVHTLFPEIIRCYEASYRRVSTSVLNDVFVDMIAMNPPAEFMGNKPKYYYISQVGVNPPTFVIFVNDPRYVHFSYLRYIENQLRHNFDFYGTPIKISLRKRD